MKLNLLTYESCVAHNAGYAVKSSAKEFANVLLKLVRQFAKEVGVKEDDIYWCEVTQSDWCKGALIIYATVPTNWQPTKSTFIYNDNVNKDRPNLVHSLGKWIRGSGERVNLDNYPATNPHELFLSKKSE